jgi:hypothetical protein
VAAPFVLQNSFAGIDNDSARDAMRPGACYSLIDYIPSRLDAPIRKRGAWSYQSTAMGACTFVDALSHAPFTAGTKLLAIGSDGNLYDNTSGTPSSLGATVAATQNPIFFNNAITMFAFDGTSTGKTYDTGGGLQALGGTPPTARYGCVFKGRLVAANTNANPRNVYFAPAGWGPGGTGGTWDTANAMSPTSQPVNGVAPTNSSILVFHDAQVERLRGSIPFGTTNSDMVLEPLFAGVGCADARSIITWNDQVIWADTRGVYQTDGAALRDLTTLTGMKSLWLSKLSGWTAPTSASTGWRIAGGLYKDHLFMSVTNTTNHVATFVFDLARNIGWRFSNFNFRAYHRAIGTTDESYVAHAGAGRTATISQTWSPSAFGIRDQDGVAIEPVIETTYFRGFQRFHRKWVESMGKQRWHYIYVTYECTDAGTDDPTLTVSCATTPDASGTYATTLTTLAETTQYTRVRIPVRLGSNGLALKIAQTNPSADTRIYAIEADYEPIEGHRL